MIKLDQLLVMGPDQWPVLILSFALGGDPEAVAFPWSLLGSAWQPTDVA